MYSFILLYACIIYTYLYIVLLYTMNKKLTVITIAVNSRLLYSMILFCDVETNFAAIIKERKKP